MTVAEALRAASIDPRDARLLLAAATGLSEAGVVGFPERPVSADAESRFLEHCQRRRKGEPLAYILGRKEFYGMQLEVNPAVLVPRPETELLVELALQRDFSTVADLGTGSGAVALAIRRERPGARVIAVEESPAALAVAQANARKHHLEIDFRLGHWFLPLAGERVDLIVANPPYVAEGDPHLPELRYEPQEALLAGPDGLAAIREIVREAPGFLASGGWLLLEHGLGQEAAVRELFRGAGLEAVHSWPDLAGIPRVTGGRVK